MFTQEQIEKVKSVCDRGSRCHEIVNAATGQTMSEFVRGEMERRWPFKKFTFNDVFGLDKMAVLEECRKGCDNELEFDYKNDEAAVACLLTSYLYEKVPATRGYTYAEFEDWLIDTENQINRELRKLVEPEVFPRQPKRAKLIDE